MVSEVERVLGRSPGVRIGEESDRDGQYFHYLAMWLYALDRLGRVDPEYRERAVELARTIHPRFARPGVGVYWKMTEDLSEPYPGYGLGALQRHRCLEIVDDLWIDPPGYFCRQPGSPAVKFAFTNYGLSVGLQAVGEGADRVERLHRFFDAYRSGDEYDLAAITHVMACASHVPGELVAPDRHEG